MNIAVTFNESEIAEACKDYARRQGLNPVSVTFSASENRDPMDRLMGGHTVSVRVECAPVQVEPRLGPT